LPRRPDGSLIALNQKKRGRLRKFFRLKAASRGAFRREVQEDFPIWSADGKYIYFSSNRSGERI